MRQEHRNTSPEDSQQCCLFFRPAEQSVIAVHALMLGLTPPPGIPPSTWAGMRAGRCEALTFVQFSAFCDRAGSGLLDDLRQLRASMRDALAAR